MRTVPIVIGLGFGDEGKGTTVDYLCSKRPVDFVVRFSGGPQTAHNVVTSDGKEHTFSLFGSGTFQGAGTILSRFVLVNPFNMIVEAEDIWKQSGQNALGKVLISENCLLITPYHIQANHQREINRGKSAHGSCGEGVGETRAYALYRTPGNPLTMKDLYDKESLTTKLEALKSYLLSEVSNLVFESEVSSLVHDYEEMIADFNFNVVTDEFITNTISEEDTNLVFEGSQGILLDESFGFHPHTTWSSVTSMNAHTLLDEAGVDRSQQKVLGITRTYTTRHGNGPFPSEFPESYAWSDDYPEKHNSWGRFQGSWRAGVLDIPLLSYAMEVNILQSGQEFDSIVLTHCDVPVESAIIQWEEDIVPSKEEDLIHQEELTKCLNLLDKPLYIKVYDADYLAGILEHNLEVPVGILSFGSTAEDKKERIY